MNQATLDNNLQMEEAEYSLQDYVAILKRRRWSILIAAAIVAVLALALALLLPAKYTSQSTILIEEQEVPREFVISTITSFAAQQIQVISQRVLTADNIAGIADKFNLFVDPATNRRPPATQMAADFRELMALELVSADVIDPRSGRPQEATIAFTLAFEHTNPSTAQRVAGELVTLFLDENLRNRTERVASTEAFLSAQADSLNDDLARIENEIAEIKRRDGPALPEMFQYNVSTLDRTTAEISDIDRRMRDLSRSSLQLKAELGLTNPGGDRASSTGEFLLSLREQIAALNREYEQKSTLYQDEHPDLLAVKRQVAELTEMLEEGGREAEGSASNPSYILLKTQLDTVEGEFAALEEKRVELEVKADRFQELISRSPSVELEYNAKQRELTSTQQKYQDVRIKQREAEFSGDMEQERKGERFVMVEPPNLPIEPSSPNRSAITAIGFILAIGAGLGLALLIEAFDNAMYDERALIRITGTPPFATVGYIATQAEIEKSAINRRRLWYMAIAGAISALILLHLLIEPLDVLWFLILNRIGL